MIGDWQTAGWPVVRIRDIGRLHGGGTPSRRRPEYFQGIIPWITGQDIPESHVAEIATARDYVTEEAVQESATRVAPAGAVLVTTRVSVGKTAVAGCPICFSQDVTAIIIHSAAIALPTYVAYFLRSRREALLQKNQGSTIAGITRDSLALEQIPLPPLSEQQRIVEILQEAEVIRRLRAEAEVKTATLVPAMFDAIYGAPSEWKGGPKLGELVKIVGGGTPSRSVEHFYSGRIPWATSKDIKKLYLDDTEEHVTKEAVQSSATNVVPKGTVLVVVKSKILAHTLPLAITQVPMCFGQDIKGLIPTPGITPEFLVYSLQAQLGRILSRARGANTEGLTLEALKSLDMPTPVPELLERFQISCEEIRNLADATLLGNRIGWLTNASLSAHAFSGQLTADWRDANSAKLAIEASERDEALKLQAPSKVVQVSARFVTTVTGTATLTLNERSDGVYSDLNREQRFVLREIKRMVGGVDYIRYFNARMLGDYIDKPPLRKNPQAIEGHIAVLVARGLLIPVSREEQTEDTGEYLFGNAYRLPLKDSRGIYTDASGEPYLSSDGEPFTGEETPGDHTRLREMERLVGQLEKERMLK